MTDQKRYTNKLNNSRILIIGGTSGLGYSVAEACLENGALVTISSSNPSRVDAAVSKLHTAYPSSADPEKPRVWGLAVDLGKPETLDDELKTLLEKTVGRMPEGKLDHVVYTAGDKLAEIGLGDMVCFASFLSSFLVCITIFLSSRLYTFPIVSFLFPNPQSCNLKKKTAKLTTMLPPPDNAKHPSRRPNPFLRPSPSRKTPPQLPRPQLQILLHHHHGRSIREADSQLECYWLVCWGSSLYGTRSGPRYEAYSC
jgi:hypothetical protein